jgi:hypothetical protein
VSIFKAYSSLYKVKKFTTSIYPYLTHKAHPEGISNMAKYVALKYKAS